MRLVALDTNVLLSALWQPAGPSARVLRAVERFTLVPVFDRRMLDEYLEVLSRPRFAKRIAPSAASMAVSAIARVGLNVTAIVEAYPAPLPDEDDRPFAEVALTTGAVLVTGNLADYPAEIGIEAMLPADAVRQLGL